MRLRRCMCVVTALVLVLAATPAIGADGPPEPRAFWGKVAGQATFPASDACLDVTGATWQTTTAVEGKIVRLGTTVVSTTHCSTLDGSAALHGKATFTAENGDQVWATYTARTEAGPPMIVQEAEFTIVGGTGGFEHATGRLFATIFVGFQGFEDFSWPVRFIFSGAITY